MSGVDFITPPTDNLYKFVAIAGLLLIALSGYWAVRAQERMAEKAAQVDSESAATVADLEAFLADVAPGQRKSVGQATFLISTPNTILDRTKAQRQQIMDELWTHDADLRDYGQYLSREEVVAIGTKPEQLQAIKDKYGLSAEQLAKFKSSSEKTTATEAMALVKEVMGETVKRARALRPRLAKYRVDLWQIWYFEDLANWWGRMAIGGFLTGLVVSAVGFSFWYKKVQRFQDLSLAQDVQLPQGKTVQ